MLLEADDPDLEAEELSKRGLAVLPLMEGSGGRDVHPKSTHGVLIRVYPSNSYKLPDHFQHPSADAAGLSGIARVLIAVEDFEEAVGVYATKLALAMDEPRVCEHSGLRSAICRAPTGGMIELVAVENSGQPLAKSVREFLDTRGEGMYALVLKSQDPLNTWSYDFASWLSLTTYKPPFSWSDNTKPILLTVGTEDPLIPDGLMEAIVAEIGGPVKLKMIEGGPHQLMLFSTAEFSSELHAFCLEHC